MDAETIQLTNLHYFFSTAPQVLGALLALSGVFVVFKHESLKRELIGALNQLINYGSEDSSKAKVFDKYFLKPEHGIAIIQNALVTHDFNMPFRLASECLHKFLKNEESRAYKNLKKTIGDDEEITNEMVRKEMHRKKGKKLKNSDPLLSDTELLIGICMRFMSQKFQIDFFVAGTKTMFITNGIILILLLSAFLFLPALYLQLLSYRLMLLVGLVLSGISIFNVLQFMVRAVSKKDSFINPRMLNNVNLEHLSFTYPLFQDSNILPPNLLNHTLRKKFKKTHTVPHPPTP